MITPIFKALREEGGTFYTFQPAMKDLTLMFSNDSNIKMNFSKFVCLNLPEWGNVTKQSMYIDPKKLESVNDNSAVDNVNTFFVKRYLQNYAENLNTILDQNREDNNFANTSELAMLKSLLSKSGNTEPPLQLEKVSEYLTKDNVLNGIYKEKKDSNYNDIIQFVGDINMLNNVKKDGVEYLEVYAHIPTQAGKLNDVQFIKNNSIKPKIAQVPREVGDDWVFGQEYKYKNAPIEEKTYLKAVYDTDNKKYDVNSELDLLKIDWDDLENPQSEYKFDNGNFEFNAILVYYDLFDINDETTVERNLYGILILDSFDTTTPTNTRIKSFKKYQPNENQSGNSFGFRFNMMFSNATNTTISSVTINDYSTISMELYMEALENLKKVALSYSSTEKMFIESINRLNILEQILLGLKDFSGQSEINSILEMLKTFVTNDQMIDYVNKELQDYVDIDELNDKLKNYYTKKEIDDKMDEKIISAINNMVFTKFQFRTEGGKNYKLTIDDSGLVKATEL